ncbi:hypothetical protein BH11PLA2_BH11PLA2_06940 [soil metagenome]
MNVPIKKLVQMLDSKQPAPVRASAAVVLGELGVKDAEASAELLERLDDKDADVRLSAIRAVGQLKVEKALPKLLERIQKGGPEAAAASEATAKLGAKGLKALQELLHKVVPGLKRYIAAALTSSGSSGADAIGISVLLDKDGQVANAAAMAIIGQIPTMAESRKKTLTDEILLLGKDKKKPIPNYAELPILRVLAAIGDQRAADLLWTWAGPPHSHDVRAIALQTAGGWISTPTKEQSKRLFQSAMDADFRVAAPALMILNKLPVKNEAEWLPLFNAPDIAARRLVMDKLGDHDTAAVAEGLLVQFRHHDRTVSETARTKLQTLKAGRKSLVAALNAAGNHDDAWALARAVVAFKDDLTPAVIKELIETASKHIDRHDHRADAFLYLLREAATLPLQEALLEKAVTLRKKKKYEEALAYLKVLGRDPGIGFAVRLELALCGLKVSGKNLDPHARYDDPCLRHFDTLMQQDFDLMEKELAKAKLLEPEDRLYVGFHFAELVGRQRQFGIDILKAIAKESKGEAGKSAKNKLKSVGA